MAHERERYGLNGSQCFVFPLAPVVLAKGNTIGVRDGDGDGDALYGVPAKKQAAFALSPELSKAKAGRPSARCGGVIHGKC